MEFLHVTVREMEEKDLPMVLEIENLCFKDKWNKDNFLYEIHDNPYSNPWVLELGNTDESIVSVVGFCVYWQTFDSATICQIAVHPTLQHRHLGSAMMDEIINDCFAKRVQSLTLEVRTSNKSAIQFYKKHGFKEEVVKPHYYRDGEDALYMTRKVDITF